MSDDLNILILSCGTRNKIVQYFKKALSGQGFVFATDCSELAPALYEADKHFIVPRMDDEGYLDIILSICKENNIKVVLTLIDPELSLLAENKETFLDIGTVPIISDFNIVEMCFDKYKMYQFLIQNGFQTVKSYIDKEQFYSDVEAGLINYPIFVKPVKGSASINISKVTSKEEIELLFSRYDNLMIQEFMDGIEFGADAYIDMISSELVAIFIKEKIKMRAGETDKSVSVKDKKLFDLIKKFVKRTGFKGIIDIDIFKINGEYFISEVNPRFGGGYPHAYESNVNIPNMIINNINGIVNEEEIGSYEEGIYMMKYNDICIKRIGQ
jgi:carbamoyl-phosphate synthase large subunit